MAFGDDISIKIGGKLYPVTQLLNKTVYAQKDTNLYRYTAEPNVASFHVKKGNIIGTVYSWIQKTDGIWLMFVTSSPTILAKYPLGNYYVKLQDISDEALKEQGAKTSDQVTKEAEEKKKAEEEANKSLEDKLLDGVKQAAKIGLVAYVILQLGKTFITTRGQSR